MIIQAFPSGPFETNAYILACSTTKIAVIIDPAPDSFALLCSYIEKHQLKPNAILLTHSHWDHIADVVAVKNHYNLPVYIHSLDAKNLESPGSDGLPCWLNIQGMTPTNLLEDGDVIPVGHLNLKVIHTPGHSPGGVCFYCSEEKILISGDTLFKGSIGNLSFSTARPASMWPSLAKLAQLPPDTHVYPGHGDKTMICKETWLNRAEEIFGN